MVYYHFMCHDPNPHFCGTKHVLCDKEGQVLLENNTETFYAEFMMSAPLTYEDLIKDYEYELTSSEGLEFDYTCSVTGETYAGHIRMYELNEEETKELLDTWMGCNVG